MGPSNRRSVMPGLPAGFTLDMPSAQPGALPPGFNLDPMPQDQINKAVADWAAPPKTAAQEAGTTMENIGKVYPVLETAANLATSAYGVPLSGLAGLFQLSRGAGLEEAGKAVSATQKALVYEPKTEGGKELQEAVSYPLTKYEEGAKAVGETIEEAGYPMVAAGVQSAISGLPAIVGGKTAIKSAGKTSLASIAAETDKIVKKGITKGIKPSSAGKKTRGQVQQYNKRASEAIQEIVGNKDNLSLVDEQGATIKGLPKTVDQLSQAIEQTKSGIFEQYDSLAKQSDVFRTERPATYPINKYPKKDYRKAIKIDLDNTANKLNTVVTSKVLKDLSPETIDYAYKRIEALKTRNKPSRARKTTGGYTAVETQEAIQVLNQSLESFYRDPSPANKGKALVDSIIANDLRSQLDAVIKQTTGKEYQALKSKYGALKTIERDVVKKTQAEARKQTGGFIPDFTDVLSGHQVVKGLAAKNLPVVAGGLGMKAISTWGKYVKSPNRIIKQMFKDVDKLQKQKIYNINRR